MSSSNRNLRVTDGRYRFRPSSFLASVGLHSVAILSLGLIHATPEEIDSRRPVWDELIKPEQRKIVWYNYKKPVEDVTATQRIGTFPEPRGREFSKDAIIATSPNAKSSKQIIWRPVPKIQLREDRPAPNLVLRTAKAIQKFTPPPQKKIEKPNVDGTPTEEPNLSPLTPNGDLMHAPESALQAFEIPKARKAFIAPANRPSRLPLPVQTSDLAAPDPSILGASSERMALPEGLGAPALSRGAPPPANGPPGAENTAGNNSKADIAVASLRPGNGPVPDGARAGAFSKAPIVGDPASGDVSGSGLKVPNLTIREDRSKPVDPPRVNSSGRTILYADRLRSIPVSTLSVPLRPASRTIPRAIDARFQSRFVYTMVIPIESFPPYSGDWILWFAERQAKPGDTPFVRAPVPLRKFESVEPVLPGAHTELRVQIAGEIKQDGKVAGLTLLRTMSPGIDQAVLQDLGAWEFKPATRDGVAVDVDFVLEIPYSLPPQIARGTP